MNSTQEEFPLTFLFKSLSANLTKIILKGNAMTNAINTLDWRCFLSLEADFVNSFNTVEFHEDNFKTFSIKYRSIILQACSEIEKFCKYICLIPQNQKSNMGEYREYLNKHHQGFSEVQVLIASHSIAATPWRALKDNKAPDFWVGYTEIKHEGNIAQAHFYNALQSLAAYFSIMVAWYSKSHGADFSKSQAFDEPKFFTINGLKIPTLCLEGKKLEIPGF